MPRSDKDSGKLFIEVSTIWSLVKKAHNGVPAQEQAARKVLLDIYQAPIRRYLQAAVHDADAVDEVFQEFALRVIGGSFHRADASRGRFRDYVKVTLRNLVHNYYKLNRSVGLAFDPEVHDRPAGWDKDASEEFLSGWRTELLNRAWESLKAYRTNYYLLLRLRTDHPDISSQQVADALNEQTRPEKPLAEVAIRKMLQRARQYFVKALIAEVAQSLIDPTSEDIVQEFITLDLFTFCEEELLQTSGRRPTSAR